MKRNFLFTYLTVFFVQIFGFAQEKTFPQQCEGTWTGTMHIYAQGKLVDSVGIVFTVTPFAGEAGSWNWKTEYVSARMPMTKDYTLVQKSNTEFLLDEGEGVLLTNYVTGSKMYSLFEVDKNWLTATYELVGDTLVFEVTSGVVSKQKSKGVTNYTVDFVQRVVLTRSN